jgi:hypothetical protein
MTIKRKKQPPRTPTQLSFRACCALPTDVASITPAPEVTDGPVPPVWVQVTQEIDAKGYPGGRFKFDRTIFDQVVANFRTHPSYVAGADGIGVADVVPWDFHHASEMDPTEGTIPSGGAPAQGWVQELDIREGANGKAQLWALTRWLEPARTYIKNGQYKWASVVVLFDSRDPVTNQNVGAMLTSVALTNQPFVEGMAPLIAASRRAAGGQRVEASLNYYCCPANSADQAFESLRGLLGLPATAAAGDVMAQLLKLQEWAVSGTAPLGVEVDDMVAGIRTILNLAALSSTEEVFAAVGTLLTRLLEDQAGREGGGTPTPVPAPAPAGAPPADVAAASRNKESADMSLKVIASKLGVQETEAACVGAVDGMVTARTALCTKLGVKETVSDVVLLEAAGGAADARTKLTAILGALGVEDPDAAIKKISDVVQQAAQLTAVMPELTELRDAQKKTEETAAEAEVGAVMNSKGITDEGVKIALTSYRKADKAGFQKQYADVLGTASGGASPTAAPVAYLKRSIASRPGGGEESVTVNADGSVSVGPKVAASRSGSKPKVVLSGLAGRNRHERAMAYLSKNEAGFDKLSYDDKFERARDLLAASDIEDTAAAG